MRSLPLPLLVLLLATAVPALSQAQEPDVPRPGDRIRVTVFPDRHRPYRRIGTLLEHGSDGLLLVTQRGDTLRTDAADSTTLEIARGTRSHFWTGVAIGGGVGALLTLGTLVAVGVADFGGRCDSSDGDPCGIGWVMVGGGAAGGALVGGLLGAATRGERWVPVPRESALRVRPLLGRRVGLALSVRF